MKKFTQSRVIYFLGAGCLVLVVFLLLSNVTVFRYSLSFQEFTAVLLGNQKAPEAFTPPEASLLTLPSGVEVNISASSGELPIGSNSGTLEMESAPPSTFQITPKLSAPSVHLEAMAKFHEQAQKTLGSQNSGGSGSRITGSRSLNVGRKPFSFPKDGRALYGDMYLRNPSILPPSVVQVINQLLKGIDLKYSYLKIMRDPLLNGPFLEVEAKGPARDKGHECDEGYRYEVRGRITEALDRSYNHVGPCILFGQAAMRLIQEKKIDMILHIGKFGMIREDGPLGEYDPFGAEPLFELARKQKIPIFIFITDGLGMANFTDIVSNEAPWSPPKSFVDSVRSTGGDVIDITGRTWHRKLETMIKQCPTAPEQLKLQQKYWFYLTDGDQHQWWLEKGF